MIAKNEGVKVSSYVREKKKRKKSKADRFISGTNINIFLLI